MPPPILSADQKALLREMFRYSPTCDPAICFSPISLASGIGLGVGEAGTAIAGLFVKDLIVLKEAQIGYLSKDGLMLATELFET